jgi:hypothetical protein
LHRREVTKGCKKASKELKLGILSTCLNQSSSEILYEEKSERYGLVEIAQNTRITSFSFLLVQLVGELEDDLLDLLHTVPVQVAGLFLQGLQGFP